MTASPPAPPGGDRRGPGPSSPGGPADAQVQAVVDSTFRQYDANGNGVLDKDEVERLPSELRRADADGNGSITREELAARMNEVGQRGGGGERRGGPGGPGESGRGGPPSVVSATPASARKSYKFLSLQERTPGGLPSWIVDNDADRDGQVTMAEFRGFREWSEELASSFARYDLNDDGIVTAAEYAKAAGGRGR